MNYYERREAKTNIAVELEKRGWTIYGWKADNSDLMTDYFEPATWYGLAEKDGFLIVVDKKDLGQYEQFRNVEKGRSDCERCKNTGVDPSGWTLDKARANPREYHKFSDEFQGSGVSLFQDVVSPITSNQSSGRKTSAEEIENRGEGLDCLNRKEGKIMR